MQASDMMRPVNPAAIPEMTIDEEIRIYRRAAIRAAEREDQEAAAKCLLMVRLLTLKTKKRRV